MLEKMVALKREEAQAVGYPEQPYDALLDDYEPEERTANVARVLAGLREQLAPLVAEIRQTGRRPRHVRRLSPFSHRHPRVVWPGGRAGDRIRLFPRAARCDGPSVLHDAWAARLPHHDAI